MAWLTVTEIAVDDDDEAPNAWGTSVGDTDTEKIMSATTIAPYTAAHTFHESFLISFFMVLL
jgi:hypothetical protein